MFSEHVSVWIRIECMAKSKCQKILFTNRSWCNLTLSSWCRRANCIIAVCSEEGGEGKRVQKQRTSQFNCLFPNVFNFWLTITIKITAAAAAAAVVAATIYMTKKLSTANQKLWNECNSYADILLETKQN